MRPPSSLSAASSAEPHVALLRGINVGGHNIIRMADLRACFEALGYADVATYIQSGNVVFRPRHVDATNLVGDIEQALLERFDYVSRVVLCTRGELERAIREAPDGFGADPDAFRYDVLFLRPGVDAGAVLQQVPVREGVDAAHAGTRVLYFSRLIARASQSRLTKLVSMPIYQEMTIRNWRTTTRLREMMQ